jgi:hypothetical protein
MKVRLNGVCISHPELFDTKSVTNLSLISFKRPRMGRFHFLYWEVTC